MDNKRVLVTGADGFIGSHLVENLVERNYKVKALSQYNSFNYWGWLEKLPCLNEIEVISGDIRDPFFCKKLLKDIDGVFHLAALIGIPYSYLAPQSYIETNVNGTLNICEAALKNSLDRVIVTSTSEVYGTADYVPIDEKHPLKPQSPYSASKISADAIAKSFSNSLGLPLTIARPFNTYGPRQSARAVIPTIITQIIDGAEQISLGDTTPTRDFNYVTDTCNALASLYETEKALGETVNIGSNQEISIKNLFELINEILGKQTKLIVDEQRKRPEASEVFRLWCDNSKLIKLTQYKPKIALKEGLKNTIDWLSDKENAQQYKSDIYNV